MKEYTEKELTYKAEAYCVAAEHCPADLAAKLRQWGADETVTASIIAHLVKERFLDETRYCIAFVRDKYRFNQWGRQKIVQALRMKQLPAEAIEAGLQEIDETSYDDGLRRLLQQKSKSIKAANEYDRNTKLIRFAIGKGFAMNEILRHIRQLNDNDEYMD